MTTIPLAASPMLDEARTLYAEHGSKTTTREIARRMDVSHEWVRQFVAGQIKNPGVLTLENFIAVLKTLANV